MKKTFFLALLLLTIFTLSGCSKKSDIENEKIKEELSFIDQKIVTILNKLNNIELNNYIINTNETTLQEENKIQETSLENQPLLKDDNMNEIKWDEIKKEIEIIKESWNVILLDIYKKNNDFKNIQEFSNSLNNSLVAIINENKTESIISLSNLYNYLPKIMSDIQLDKPSIEIKQTKAYVLQAYSNINQNEWDNASVNLTMAEEEFIKVMNNLEYINNKENKINNVYIQIKELQNELKIKDINIFFLYYRNLIKEINKL